MHKIIHVLKNHVQKGGMQKCKFKRLHAPEMFLTLSEILIGSIKVSNFLSLTVKSHLQHLIFAQVI